MLHFIASCGRAFRLGTMRPFALMVTLYRGPITWIQREDASHPKDSWCELMRKKGEQHREHSRRDRSVCYHYLCYYARIVNSGVEGPDVQNVQRISYFVSNKEECFYQYETIRGCAPPPPPILIKINGV